MPSATELRELDDEELEERLGEYRKELLNLRFQLATGQLDNVARVGQVRRDVARILTLLRDREIALVEGRSPSTGRMRPVEPAAPVARRSRRTRTEEATEAQGIVEPGEAELAQADIDMTEAEDDEVEVVTGADTTDEAPADDGTDDSSGADGEDE